ncbi:MAG: hypothetical protein DWQ31_18740 [Planctomycetota bacterium]|nr:MAG: hypothetical protein DWQ31_18740 [Planctomycetota bacterium]
MNCSAIATIRSFSAASPPSTTIIVLWTSKARLRRSSRTGEAMIESTSVLSFAESSSVIPSASTKSRSSGLTSTTAGNSRTSVVSSSATAGCSLSC